MTVSAEMSSSVVGSPLASHDTPTDFSVGSKSRRASTPGALTVQVAAMEQAQWGDEYAEYEQQQTASAGPSSYYDQSQTTAQGVAGVASHDTQQYAGDAQEVADVYVDPSQGGVVGAAHRVGSVSSTGTPAPLTAVQRSRFYSQSFNEDGTLEMQAIPLPWVRYIDEESGSPCTIVCGLAGGWPGDSGKSC